MLLAALTLGPQDIINAYITTATRPLNIEVIVTSAIISAMAFTYKNSGMINVLSNSVLAALKKAWLAITITPAIFGFLPVAGGALMSAPIVDDIGKKIGINSIKAAYTNVWFRHVIAPIFPLTQILILASGLSGINVTQLALYDIPLITVMFLVGFIPIFKDLRGASVRVESTFPKALASVMPLLISILMIVLGVNVILSALAGLLTLIIVSRPSRSVMLKSVANLDTLIIVLVTYAALSIREVLWLGGFPELFASIFNYSESVMLISIILMSACLGFILGTPTGALALTIPIVASVTSSAIKFVSLTIVITYIGYIISPSHLCLILTSRYFKVNLSDIYRYLIPSAALTACISVLIYAVLI